MALAGIIISSAALILSITVYFVHDKKIKKQEALLNEWQIDKIKSEQEEAKKAIVETNVIKEDKGKRIVKIYNKGKATAKNTIITIPESDGYGVLFNPSPIDIRPQNGVDITMSITMESPKKIEIGFEWQDEYSKNNKDTQTIQLI